MPSYIDLPYLGKNASVAVKRGWGVVRLMVTEMKDESCGPSFCQTGMFDSGERQRNLDIAATFEFGVHKSSPLHILSHVWILGR
jgi:hypothetical protein